MASDAEQSALRCYWKGGPKNAAPAYTATGQKPAPARPGEKLPRAFKGSTKRWNSGTKKRKSGTKRWNSGTKKVS